MHLNQLNVLSHDGHLKNSLPFPLLPLEQQFQQAYLHCQDLPDQILSIFNTSPGEGCFVALNYQCKVCYFDHDAVAKTRPLLGTKFIEC